MFKFRNVLLDTLPKTRLGKKHISECWTWLKDLDKLTEMELFHLNFTFFSFSSHIMCHVYVEMSRIFLKIL